jgi:signal transduction histidine kinase
VTDAPLRLLLVEDNPGDARLVREALSTLSAPSVTVSVATSLAQAIETLACGAIDVVLSDLDLPDSEGLETCTAMVRTAPGLPVVVLTGRDGDRMGAEAIRLGAQDYLEKGEHIAVRLQRALSFAQERQRLLRREQAARASTEEANRRIATAYERLAQLERARDGMVQMIIHDLRSPLTAVCGYLELGLRRAENLDPVARRHFAIADSQAGILVEMVSSILDISRMEAGEFRPQRVDHDVTALAIQAVERVRGVALDRRVDISTDPAVVACDGDLVRRVIANLVANALRYSPRDKAVSVAVVPHQGQVRVAVEDHGPGIPIEAQARLFSKFATLDDGTHRPYSTGLGLHFCKLAVEAHGGSIGLDSASGKGSRFWFVLPMEQCA